MFQTESGDDSDGYVAGDSVSLPGLAMGCEVPERGGWTVRNICDQFWDLPGFSMKQGAWIGFALLCCSWALEARLLCHAQL